MLKFVFKYLLRKKVNYKICFISLLSSFVLVALFFVHFNIDDIEKKMMDESLSSNYFVSFSNEKKSYDFGEIDFINEVLEFSNYSIGLSSYNVNFNGREFKNKMMKIFASRFDYSKGKFFSQNELKEYERKNHSNPIIMGRYPQNMDEMMVTESFFKVLDLNPEVDRELSVEIPFGPYQGEAWISRIKIVGVISDDIFELDSYSELKEDFIPSLFFLSSELEDKVYIVNRYSTEAFMDDFINIEERLGKLNELFGEKTFSFGNETKMILFDSINRYGSLISFLMTFIGIILIFGFFLLDTLLIYFDIKENKRKYFVYYSSGLTKKQCFMIVAINYCLVSLIGLILGCLIFGLLFIILKGNIPYLSLMDINLKVIFSAIMSFSLISGLVLLFTGLIYRRQEISTKNC